VTKKRVYDLAKEYGMTGQDLAAKLKDLGFPVKSHMTALDDFQVIEIQARLEAYGVVGESSQSEAGSVGGLKIKRKKKRAPSKPAAEPEEKPKAEEPAEPEPAAARPAEPAEPPPRAKRPVPEEAERIEPPAEPTEPPAPAAGAEPPAVEEPERLPEPAEAPAEPAEPEHAEAEGAEPAAAVEPEEAAGTEESTSEGDEIVRPSARRRAGKVVGFIDPSQFQQQPQKKSESRRLRSSDEELPDVRPTLGRDRGTGVVRGDTLRGALTAQQLREREAGRFLRRRRQPATGAGPSPGRRSSGGQRMASAPNASPHAGSPLPIDSPVTIKKLANALAVKENEVLKVALQQLGFGININSLIDDESAILLANEFQVELEVKQEVAAEETLLRELEQKRQEVAGEYLIKRPPTVAVLGHVDHGKTTLIDTVRKSRIVQGESGGITQHIGAYQVQTKSGHLMTIIDTPGHAAFTQMRARGAKAVDVAILVVASDDGVMPQTEEALNHVKAAKTPVVVAINKIDKPDANPDRVMNGLATLGLTPEEWGGDTAMIRVSALQGTGVDDLLERVFLESEVLELKSHPTGPAHGVVLEAEIQQGKGKVAHLLVQDGCLKRGDVILAGEGYGKVRSIHDDRGNDLDEAGPSMPVEVTGLNELPSVGDHFHVVEQLDQAQEVAAERARKNRQLSQIERRTISNENLLEAVAQQEKASINLIVKTDVQGSAEVLKHQLGELGHAEVDVKVVHAGVGAVLESDVDLAVTSNARILAFHTSANNRVRQAAERAGIEIKVYDVIYELLDDVRRLMEGELKPEYKEEVTGHAEIRRVFKSSKIGNIAGCYVLDGKIRRSNKARLLRDDQVVYSGAIGSLRRESDDVRDVREGFECGIVLKDYNDVREGDVVEVFEVHELKRTL